MSRPISINSAITVNVSAYSGSTGSVSAGNTTRGVNSSANTSNYATFSGTSTTNSGYAYYTFDTTEIPTNATINSVSCAARSRLSNSSGISGALQLMSGTSAKGSIGNVSTTTTTVYNLTGGTWTNSEARNIALRITVIRTGGSIRSLRFYGATLTVNYSINGVEYEVSIDNQSSDASTEPSSTQYVEENKSLTINIFAEEDSISVDDNGVDVTDQLTLVPPYQNTHQVDSIDGVSYGFALSGQYYRSQNTGQNSSAALCRINMNIVQPCTLTMYFVNYAEATYDYGVIGNLDTALSTSYNASDANVKWKGDAASSNTNTEQSVVFDIPSGSHFIDVKYRKDSYTESGNDAFWFRYVIEPESSDTSFYTYEIPNIQADHAITINDAGGTFYAVNAASNYAGATVSPATKQVREGRSHTVTITAQNAYEFRVLDNNVDVTSSVVSDGSNFTYTVSNVTAEHNIVINEATKYLVAASSKYAGTTISPASSYVYSGQSITLTISGFSAKNRVKDNGTDVTSSLIQSGSNYLYTISNVSQAHEVVIYYEDNFIKVNGVFKQVRKYYKKVNGEWTEITSSDFNSEIENSVLVYGGQQTGTTVIGEVVKSGSTVEILINDNALQSGSYKFVYEDETKAPLDNVDEIKEFTIS